MKEATAFLTWCKQHGNSPDILNLRWFLENRTEYGYPGDATCQQIFNSVKALKVML